MAKKRKAAKSRKAKVARPTKVDLTPVAAKKPRKSVAKKKRRASFGEMEAIKAALDVAGVPSVDSNGGAIDSVAGRVILAMSRFAPPSMGPNLLDPQHPERMIAAADEQQKMRARALRPGTPEKAARKTRRKK